MKPDCISIFCSIKCQLSFFLLFNHIVTLSTFIVFPGMFFSAFLGMLRNDKLMFKNLKCS